MGKQYRYFILQYLAIKDIKKDAPKKPEVEVETEAMKEKRLELEEKLEWLLVEIEKHKKISKELQKEYLLTEIKNELLTHIVIVVLLLRNKVQAVEKNTTYNDYVKDIEEHK